MSGLDGLGWPNPEDEPKPNKTMNSQLEIKLAPTPETDAMEYCDAMCDPDRVVEADFARKLERERDEARGQRDELREWASVNGVSSLAKDRDQFRARLREEQQLHVQMLNERDQLEERLRVELGGHPDSELWGDTGLIAATMRCVDALDGVTEQRDYYKLACDKYSEDEMMNTLQSLKGERDEAREYADKLVAHKDMVCLPKDLEVLREANLGLAVELNEAQNEILGWKNKWDCAIEMGARAECERDEMTLRRNLAISLLDEECALADRLGTELEIALSRPCPRSGESIKALTAWKEARK